VGATRIKRSRSWSYFVTLQHGAPFVTWKNMGTFKSNLYIGTLASDKLQPGRKGKKKYKDFPT
jgi:hypothetical protein